MIHAVLLSGLLLLACGDNRARPADGDGGVGRPDARVDGPGDASVDAPLIGFAVGGTAVGVRGNVVLTLTTATDTRHATINADGAFTFPGRVAPGSSFVITTASTCDLFGETGTNVTADVTTVEAFCEGVVQLADVAFASGVPAVAFTSTLTPAFDPGAYTYSGTRPFFMDDSDVISVTPTAAYPTLPTITVYTDATSSGQSSPSHVVGTVAPVRLQHAPTLDRTYQFTLIPSRPTQAAFLKASTPASSDNMGTVALSGSVLVAGAPMRAGTGAAFVLRRGATGWTEEQVVQPTAVAGARAGNAVAIDGDVLVVGAPFDATGGSGRAYVYRYAVASGTWIVDAGGTLAPNTTAGVRCGSAVAISGTQIIIGCPGEKGQGNATDAGAVYMYRYDAPTSAWVADGTFRGLNATDTLGAAVAISGTSALVGAPNEDNGTTSDAGGVHVLVRGASSWSKQGSTLRGELTAGSRFGTAVAISGDYAIVGAPDVSSGSAYVFHRVATTWSQDGPTLAPTAPSDPAAFGRAVAIDGTHAVIGAPKEDGSAGDTGAVHAYRREATGWTTSFVIGASNPSAARFGASVAVDGEWIAAGAPEESTTATLSGAVYVFR